jgi:ribonuclease PH
VRALFARHYLDKFLAEGIRPDGRAFAEARRTACAPGVIAAADGSASVQVGNTSVVAGVQLSPFCPPAVGSASGRVVVVVDVGQLGSSLSNARPDDHARALSDFVTRTLRQTRVVDEDGQLVIKRGVAAWTVTLTISCLNFDGNLLDALLLVAVAALLRHDGCEPAGTLPAIQAFHAVRPLGPAEVEALWPLVVLRGAVLVVTEGPAKGRTIMDEGLKNWVGTNEWQGRPQVAVAAGVRSEALVAWVLERMGR